MLQPIQRHATVAVCGAVLVFSCAIGPIAAQAPPAGRRPLSYDAYDAWWSIQGTTLSRDGEWLAYALTAHALDGELVVRNLRTGQEHRHPRGTNPTITPDGRFVVFTIVQTRAEEEKERESARHREGEGRGEGRGEGQGRHQRNHPRTAAGIMALPNGQVTTIERVGTISLPAESSTWVALHRRAGGDGAATGRGGRGGAAASGRAGQRTGQRDGPANAERRKDPGGDLILRNLTTGEDTVIPLVSTFAWNRGGSWLAYGVSSEKPEEDGAFARRISERHGARAAERQGQLQRILVRRTVVFTLARLDEFPDLWVSDTTFQDMKKVSSANPQQAEYIWGKAELTHYINADGRSLRAILIKPEDFDPSRTYPLMVYIYEELSEGLHTYRAPNPGTSINITRYVSNGYVVLLPDIVYDTGYSGESAEKCVIPAVNAIVAQGYIDPKRIGIQGHSWGGYQITHLITRTNLFDAVQAGASVSNMISAYGGIRWGSGMSRAFQYEKTQSRIGAPPWEAPLQFIENSPIFWVQRVQTPYLTIHNDEDDAVPWYQAIEFFTALRRLGKEASFFNYNGEAHGLRQRDNQKHWTVHQDEFFDHFLLGGPKPAWMEKGVPYLQRGTRDVSDLFKPKVTRASTTQAAR